MKKLLILFAVSLVLFGCGNKDGYTIKGDIKGLSGRVMLLDDKGQEVNSADVTGTKFKMTGIVDAPGLYTLADEDGQFAMLILERGVITVTGNLSEDALFTSEAITIGGTPANVAFSEGLVEMNELMSGDIDEETFISDAITLMRSILEKNKDNYAGVIMIQNLFTMDEDRESLLNDIESLSPEFQNDESIQRIRQLIETSYKLEIGEPYINIELPDGDGNVISLSDVIAKGQYVLIDFWASWCAPCMGEIPHLKEAYTKFHEQGFEIYGVALNDKETDWRNAISNNRMDWIQVKASRDDAAADDYAVKSIPANFLISPEGIIVAKNLRGEELTETLAGIFKK